MAADRYRWGPWQKSRKTDPQGNYGYMWDEEDERLVSPVELAVALNAAEDAGRLKAALEFAWAFVPRPREDPDDPMYNAKFAAAYAEHRQALKAEPKEATR